MEEEKKEQTRIRLAFKVTAKGDFQPDVTSEAETVATAVQNLDVAYDRLMEFATSKGYSAKPAV